MKRMGSLILFALLLPVSSLSPQTCQSRFERFTFVEYHMGVDARIILYAPGEESARKAARRAFDRIALLDSIMSDYRKDSELSLLSTRAVGQPIKVSKHLWAVLKRAEEVWKRSEGSFDITVGPLINLWRAARRSKVLPSNESIEAARALVGQSKAILENKNRTVRLVLPNMKLDLGGIAKGYACDEAQKELKRAGILMALVEMGGDIVVSGPPPDMQGWPIKVTNANTEMTFSHCAISTSGDTEQFVIIDGKRFSHVVDPQTGMALTNRVQVTVIAKDGLTSDPISTALTVASEDVRQRLLRSYGINRCYLKQIQD